MSIDTDSAYTAARLRAARSRLIRKAEYDRLLRMGDAEVISYLQAGAYRADVDALGVKDLNDLEAIDRIIATHEDRVLTWLARISTPVHERTVNALRQANDAWNVRVASEAIAGKEDVAQALRQFARLGTRNVAPYALARSIPDLTRAAQARFPRLRGAPEDLVGFLDALERAHATDPLPDGPAGMLLADARNITRVLRCVRDRVPPEHTMLGVSRGGRLSRGILRRIAASRDLDEALRLLRETAYRDAVTRSLAAREGAPAHIEEEIRRSVLRALARTASADPMGDGPIARHIADTQMESVNLRLLVKARRLGLDEAFVRERLVVP